MKKLVMALAVALLAGGSAFAQRYQKSPRHAKSHEKTERSYNRVYFGYNPTSILNNADKDESSFALTQVQHGVTFGFTHGLRVARKCPLFMELGARINYSFGREKSEVEREYPLPGIFPEKTITLTNTTTKNVRHLNLAVPVNLTYRITLPNSDFSLSPFAGITFKYNAICKENITTETQAWDNDLKTVVTAETSNTSNWMRHKKADDKHYNQGVGYDYVGKRFKAGWQFGVNLGYKSFFAGVHYGEDFGRVCSYYKAKSENWGVSVGVQF